MKQKPDKVASAFIVLGVASLTVLALLACLMFFWEGSLELLLDIAGDLMGDLISGLLERWLGPDKRKPDFP